MDFHKRQFDQKRSPVDCGLRGYFMPRMSGAEGQSRTDTELPPPVFEFDAGRFTLSHRIPYSPVP